MATIFQQIDSALSGNGLPAQLAAQAGKITGAGSQLQSLKSGKLPALDNLAGALGGLAPPQLSLPDGFTSSFSSLSQVIPTDGSGITGGLTKALGDLGSNVDSNIAGKLEGLVGALAALAQLAQNGFAPLTPPPSGSKPVMKMASASGPPPPDPAKAAAAQKARLAAINQANSVLSALPAFDAPTLVTFAQGLTTLGRRDLIPIRKLPFFDDLGDMLTSVVSLRSMDVSALTTYLHDTTEALAAFLTSNGGKPLAGIVASLSGLAAKLDTASLKTQTSALASHLAKIGAAVQGGDISGAAADVTSANAALDMLLPAITGLNANLFQGQVDAATAVFEALPVDTERHMRRVLQAIHPPDQALIFRTIGDRIQASIQVTTPDELAKDLDQIVGMAVKALDIVNVTPIREPLLTAIDGVKSAADKIDQLLAQAAAQTGQLFAQADQILAKLDVSQVTQGIQQAIASFQSTLQQQVSQLFEPARSAISDAVTGISSAVSGFKPDDIITALQDVIQKLAGVLQSPDIQNAINTIQQAIQAATSQIKSISFAAITGEVIGDIDQITGALKAMDPSQISPEVKLAMKAAVAILPGDLKPVTNPLVTEFGQLVDTGAKPVLVLVEGPPEKLMKQIQGYSPANLIGDQLSKPFQDFIGELEKFKPSALLTPVEQALDGIKAQFKQKADPGQLLQPLESLFDQLMAQFDKLKPEELVKPLNDLVQGAIGKVLAALPVDAVLQTFNMILGKIQSVTDTAVAVKTTLEKAGALFDGLANPAAQLRTWLQPIFDHVDQIADVSALQPSFDKVSAAVNSLKATAMRLALDAVVAPLRNGITDLNPANALAAVGAAYGSIRPDQVAALATSQGKTDIQKLLARFNPVSPDFSRLFEGLQNWLPALTTHQAAFEALLVHWDLRFHGANGPFADFLHPAINAGDLKSILHDALENEIVLPLAHLMGAISTIAEAAKPPLQKVTAVIDAFDQKVQDVLLGPGSLGGLRDAVNSLVTRLKNINFNFLATQLNTTFQAVRSKLLAISPAALRALVEKAFDDALNLLDVKQLLPRDAIAAIDQAYQKIIDGLKAFDPKKLIVDVVQPTYDSTITPLLKAFDVTALFKAVGGTLDALKGELGGELDKVNQHYQAMLAAVPQLSLADVAGAATAVVGDIAGSFGF